MHPLLKPFREALRPLKRARENAKRLKIFIDHPPAYHEDGLFTNHICDFLDEPGFQDAYKRGMQAVGGDYGFRWRIHTALWAASHAAQLEGDFVECGVNRGFISSSVMRHLDWNSLSKQFYLFDTFCGLDITLLNEVELARGSAEKSKAAYSECYESAKENFSEFNRVHLVRGSIPSTLNQVEIEKVAYLSIDMNCAAPEIAAAQHFWPKLVSGGIILLDDYAYGARESTREQKKAFDQFAKKHSIKILSLPTGQGMILKP